MQFIPLLLSELAGCIVGVVSVVIVAELLGASREVVLSLAPKAVTTPIAMEVASVTGGIPPLTSAVVICTGIFGSIVGFRVLQLGEQQRYGLVLDCFELFVKWHTESDYGRFEPEVDVFAAFAVCFIVYAESCQQHYQAYYRDKDGIEYRQVRSPVDSACHQINTQREGDEYYITSRKIHSAKGI